MGRIATAFHRHPGHEAIPLLGEAAAAAQVVREDTFTAGVDVQCYDATAGRLVRGTVLAVDGGTVTVTLSGRGGGGVKDFPAWRTW